jgi:2Fe-2S ferredoxin
MQVALAHDVPGIIGECGGSAMCATCHIYVDEDQLSRLDAIAPIEEAMLGSTAAPRRPTSRLGCQIALTETLHGLVVCVPEKQA